MEGKKYQPTNEEIEKAEEMMTPEQKYHSHEAEAFHLPATWIEKYEKEESAVKEAIREVAYEECCRILEQRYEKYDDYEFAFWLGSEAGRSNFEFPRKYGRVGLEGREEALKMATELLNDWKPTEDEIKFFAGQYYCEE